MNKELPMKTLWAALALAVVEILLYFFLDRPATELANAIRQSGTLDVAKGISVIADSGGLKHLLAIGLVVSAANLLGASPRPWARDLLYVCLSLSAAFIVTDALKYLFGRARPPLFLDDGIYGFTWFASKDLYNSFPSGHTTRAFAVCAALAILFRRYAALFIAIATLVGLSRIFALRHYPSDVLAGAFVGVTAAYWTHALFFGGAARRKSAARAKSGGEDE